MIIEKINQDELRKRNHEITELEELLEEEYYSYDDSVSVQLGQRLLELSKKPIPSELLYIPEHPSAHEMHAIEGTQWTYDGKPEPARTYPKEVSISLYVICLILSPVMGVGLAYDGHAGESIFAFAGTLFALLALASESKTILTVFHNHRIKKVDVKAIKKYELNSTAGRHLKAMLGNTKWLRLKECLDRNDDRQIQRIVVNYFDDATEARNTLTHVRQSTIVKELSDTLVEELATKIDEIVADAIREITDIFSRYDADAAEDKRIAAEKAEEERIVIEAASEADEVSLNATIVSEAARIVAKPRRYT